MLTEKEKEYQRRHYRERREYKLAYQKQYREKNREAVLRARREWYHRNRDAMLVYWKKYNSENKDRRRWIVRKCKYGITPSEFESLLERQNGKCAICDAEFAKVQARAPHIDHCSETGRIRGLLCSRCNTGIGLLQHSPRILVEAINYLSPVLNVTDAAAV
jgi:hypothetical protein